MRALAQLRSEAATDTLLGVLETAEGEDLVHVVLALGYQANPRALPALQALRGVSNDNSHFPQILESAILRFHR